MIHAKSKLDDFCKKKYGSDYQYIVVISCTEKMDLGDIFGKGFGDMFGGGRK
jgi:membrane glycosyltransferase